MTLFKDVADDPEDERIRQIGQVASKGATVAFVTDKEGLDGWEKADRYVAKLLSRFPILREHSRFEGPVPDSVTVKVCLKGD